MALPVRYLLLCIRCKVSFYHVSDQYSESLTHPWVASRDRAACWMIAQKCASGRKPFWFHHLLKYESTGFIAQKRATIHLFRSCSIGSWYWLLFTTHSPPASLSLFPPSSSPAPSPSPHHLNVAMLSWQLKCFLSACWVNWLSQKCFLPFTLLPANVHTSSHVFFILARTLIVTVHCLAPSPAVTNVTGYLTLFDPTST